MSEVKLSFICACNNRDTLNKFLIPSLKKQANQAYELIVVDAKEHGFKSAAETLNYGASLTNTDRLCFVHQDIAFLNDDAVDKIIGLFDNEDFGIAGVAGEIGDTKKTCLSTSSVVMTEKLIRTGLILTKTQEAYAVDECVMFIKKKDFMGFDDFGPTWHFYGAEYSLRCLKNGRKVLAVPIDVYHDSTGDMNDSYWDTLLKVGRRHKDVKTIKTTCGVFNNGFLLPFYCFAHKVKNRLFKRRK